MVVIEFPDGLHEYVTTPVRRILREATATSDSEKLSLAQQRLLDHLAQVKPIGVRDWTRDDLYD